MIWFRLITTLKLFWKIRHFFGNYTYSGNYNAYKKIFKNIKDINSVLDFGCAHGEKLNFFIRKKKTRYIYCIDINPDALRLVRDKILNSKKIIYSKYTKVLSKKNLENFYLFSQKKKFDLFIFSRVLYLINDREFYKLISVASNNCKYLLIDDFYLNHSTTRRTIVKLYRVTNFNLILKNNFDILYSGKSPVKKVNQIHNPVISLYRNKKF